MCTYRSTKCVFITILVIKCLRECAGLEVLYANEISRQIHSACHFLLSKNSSTRHQVLVDELSIVYIDDDNVVVGLTDFGNFLWPNGDGLRIKKLGNEKFNYEENDILYIKQEDIDRTCLTKSPYTVYPDAEVYGGVFSLESMVKFVNEKCNTYKTVNGHTNFKGLHRSEILSSFYSVSAESEVNMRRLYQSVKHPFSNILIDLKARKNVSVAADPKYDVVCAECFHRSGSNHKFCSNVCNHNYSQYSKEMNSNDDDVAQNTEKKNFEIQKCQEINLPLSREDFVLNYLEKSKPVVIKNGAKMWRAFDLWSNTYLVKKYGKEDVHVKLTPGGDFEGVEKAELWDNYDSFTIPHDVKKQLHYPDLVVVRPAAINMNFSKFVNLITSAAEQEERNISAYLEYSSIPNYMPELQQDLKEFEFASNLKLRHLNMWLSDGYTLGRLHFDPYDNFLCQLRGKKQVILFEPHNNDRLYEAHIPQATLSYNSSNNKFSRRRLEDTTSMVMSPVDILNPDFERFKKFGDAVPLNCTIEEGDVLYMPAFWWHEVYSWPNKTEKRNLAVNYWYEPFLHKEFPCQECKMDVNPFYRNLL